MQVVSFTIRPFYSPPNARSKKRSSKLREGANQACLTCGPDNDAKKIPYPSRESKARRSKANHSLYRLSRRDSRHFINIGRVSQTQLTNILLLRSFVYTAYLKSKSNYMFRHLYLGHHQVERMSYVQPDDGLDKRPKHVAALVLNVRYVILRCAIPVVCLNYKVR